MIEETERYNFRYQLRELVTLPIFGVVVNSLIAGGLLRLSFSYLNDEQVWLLVVYATGSSLLAVVVTSTLLRSLIRGNMVTYTVHLLVRVIVNLTRIQGTKRLDGPIRYRRHTIRLVRTTRQDLRSNSWILTGKSGRSVRPPRQ